MRKRARDAHKDGLEYPDPQPLYVPVKRTGDPHADYIRSIVRSEQLRIHEEKQGNETFEEADDFEVGDDYDPQSPYEEEFDPGPEPDQLTVEEQRKFLGKFREFIARDDPDPAKPSADEEQEGDSPPATD